MGRLVKLSDLVTKVRARGEYRAPFITDVMLKDWINDSLPALFDLMLEDGPLRFKTHKDISIISGKAEYDLPDNFYKLVGVDVVVSSAPTGFRQVDRMDWHDRHRYLYESNDIYSGRYDIIDERRIVVYPSPAYNATWRIHFVPNAAKLEEDEDTFDSVNSWTEWVVLDVAMKCATKKNDGRYAEYRDAQTRTEKRILLNVTQDTYKPKTVANVRDGDTSWYRRRRPGSTVG